MIAVQVVLTCDHCGIQAVGTPNTAAPVSMVLLYDATRMEARRAGWGMQRVNGESRDYCPTCERTAMGAKEVKQ